MLNKQKLIKFIGYFFIVVIVAVFSYTLIQYHEIKADLENEIELYGPLGLLIAGIVVDSIGGPFGPEVPVIAGLLADIPIPTVIYMTGVGSAVASLIVYFFGYFFGEYGALYFVSRENYDKWRRVFHRHRRITMVLASLTPVPYVTVCVISGIFKVHLLEYLIFVIGARLIRIIGVAYIVLLFQGTI